MNMPSFEDWLAAVNERGATRQAMAYRDLSWDDPDHALRDDDPRLAWPSRDALGSTTWFRTLPACQRSRMTLHYWVIECRYAVTTERRLLGGLWSLCHHFPPDSREFRFLYQEIGEEVQHSLMFHEFLRRASSFFPTGLRGEHPPSWRDGLLMAIGRRLPHLCLALIVIGESEFLTSFSDECRSYPHPLLRRIMTLHVKEEVTHLQFAERLLRHRADHISPLERSILRAVVPRAMRAYSRSLYRVSPILVETYGIPRDVLTTAYDDNTDHARKVGATFRNLRLLCRDLGILDARTEPKWRAWGLLPSTETS